MAVINLSGKFNSSLFVFKRQLYIFTIFISQSVILALSASFLGASGALWIMVFIYAFLSNAFFLVRLFFLQTHAHCLFILFISTNSASLSAIRCPTWPFQRTTCTCNDNRQFGTTSAPHHLFVFRSCNSDSLHGMVSENMIGLSSLEVADFIFWIILLKLSSL